MPVWLQHARQHRPLYFAAGAGLLIAGIGIASHGETWGSGYGAARAMLADGEKVGGFYAALKMATMVLSYLPGFPGGFFAPSLAIGAGFGQMLGTLFPSLPLSALIALAMVGYLAAVTQSPITAFVIVMEMIDGHGMVISLMATAWLASKVASVFTQPLYKALAENFLAAARPAQ